MSQLAVEERVRAGCGNRESQTYHCRLGQRGFAVYGIVLVDRLIGGRKLKTGVGQWRVLGKGRVCRTGVNLVGGR